MDTTSYKLRRMTGAELSSAMNRADVSVSVVRRMTGASAKKFDQWLADEEDIPPWMAAFMAACAVPEALQAARDEAERRLIAD